MSFDTSSDSFEFSEFSILEILYMGHQGLTFYVESLLDVQEHSDPFDIIAAQEELRGHPLVFPRKGESDM